MRPKRHEPHSLLCPSVSLCQIIFCRPKLPCLLRLSHEIVHEGEEAYWRGGDARGVDEAAGEEAAEDGSEVGVGDLEQSSLAFPHSMR